ncbi:MAG: DUF1565 domain-containing protein [Verrucomicrobia bacterium]|nr:DUF1565 domain-containing protein [Verrucomicrobiota bacterium]
MDVDTVYPMNDCFSSRSLSLFTLVRWMQFCRALIFLGLLFCPFGIVHAVTYVVSPSGSDTSTNGDLSTPFSTIEKALSVAQPGDSVQLRAGTYREAINPPRSGTAQNPIVIEAYPGESVTVSALDEVTGPWTAAGNGIYTATVSGSLPVSFWSPEFRLEFLFASRHLESARFEYRQHGYESVTRCQCLPLVEHHVAPDNLQHGIDECVCIRRCSDGPL